MRGIHILCFIAGLLCSTVAMNGQQGPGENSRQILDVQKNVTASIIGSGAVCDGDSILAYISMTGKSPWKVEVSNTSGVYAEIDGVTSPHGIWLKPESNDIYTVTNVVDFEGDTGTTFGQAVVTLNYSSPVSIIMDRTSFLSTELGVELNASLEPGIYSGPGVSEGFFYPSIASAVGSPHTVSYTYANQYGCFSSDSIKLSVIEGSGSVVLLSGNDTLSVLCSDEGTYEIVGSNKEGIAGSFELVLTNSNTQVPGHIDDDDPSDNRAIFEPSGLEGGYDIIYSYTIDGVPDKASYFVRVDLIPTLSFISAPPSEVCKNGGPYELKGNLDNTDPLANWSFSGDGVSGNMSNGFYYNPADDAVELGSMEILYSYSTEGGCSASATRKLSNLFVPDVSFKISTSCISDGGDEVEFDNRTTGKYAVDVWNWSFGDVGSGSANYSTEQDPTHFYAEAGQRRINLTATTNDGCIAYYELDTVLVGTPDVDFTWISDCYSRGEKLTFINKTETSFSVIDTLVWTFMTSEGSILGELGKSPDEDTIQFPFTSIDTYQVELFVSNKEGCSNALTKDITLNPSYSLPRAGRLERFNSSQGGWNVHSENGNESWTWGVPDFEGYQPAYGDKAWYTDLPFGVAGYSENSWIQSPCYDFSEMRRPLIRLDLLKSFVPNLTGAVLQYQDITAEGWKTIGKIDDGVEWYNSGSILNKPGGSSFGWGLDSFEPDESMVTAIHDLDSIAGKTQVKFRIAFASNGRQQLGNQGVAVDNIHFVERSRKSILEHFTNSSDLASHFADGFVDAFYTENSRDVVDVQYHSNYPGEDPMNQNNPDPASTRAGALGVGQIPYAMLDGGVLSSQRFNFTNVENSPGSEALSLSSLDIPKFNIAIDMDWLNTSFTADVTVVCNTDTFINNVQLYVLVIESEVTAYTGLNGDSRFRNVVLDMLPSPAGKLLGNGWARHDYQTLNFTWDYASYVEDKEDLGLIVFVQDRESGEVLQAATCHVVSSVGIEEAPKDAYALSVYPNPASEIAYVNIGERSSREGRLEITDLSGRVLMATELVPGYGVYQLDLSAIPQGIYMICWFEEGSLMGRSKLVRTR